MGSKADWEVFQPEPVDADRRMFFDEHQWETIEAATARIIPTDHEPGAREAKVVRFIDRYLSGIDYVFASPDGDGFLKLDGRIADAWAERIADMGAVYREGVQTLDELSNARFGARFKALDDEQQDAVLEELSGKPKPEPIAPGRRAAASTILQAAGDDGLAFFDALVLHTRQGFYGDPVYGGNAGRVGWQVIGFPGPESLADTRNGTYNIDHLHVRGREWTDLVPHLRETEA
jgi:gluconate 2-dehydrogenase gamma chain